ncbi:MULTISPECIES: oligopeptide ABC transporter permease [unclassified Exiguobacterium]|uniref:oligopeptide ABC transporter permease n=1 Tax=unclassified Exiguobacterium TaxID=2644629 RepID=UPI00103FA5CF|nr:MULTISPECIES: oligopeptide ABC transporter permease [unclassified Exiguobacterium]TCI37510.1 ABC transporter permease [Exiguobacterium sp. SH4S7]TCI45843.1 ABC transporter permease [Exiguobacterium sp. SH5S32]TCI51599.1 ABC transporter permease [Exiguobacterium sp. SH1S4]TCI53640.1 ABC transporter permease [Exiguobacterium sp. SH1S21]TCI65616.1 ABC transporter permease [Exiguobacterium sp. SH0S2]
MGRYILQRLVYGLITFFLIATFTFFLMDLLPGSPYQNQEKLTETQIQILNDRYGLNDPLPVRYATYLGNLVQGDLGVSFRTANRPVTELIMERIGPSAQLGIQALVLGTLTGLLLGIVAAIRHNTYIDYGSMFVSVIGISVPSFVFAALLQYYVGVKWGVLPVAFWDSPAHTILPTISLSLGVTASIARFVRTEMLEVTGQDYVTLAKAKGLTGNAIVWKHMVRNAMIPAITILGPMTAALLTGTFVIEKIFAVPGLGELFVTSITLNDYSVIMGTTLFFSALFIVIILLVDLLYGVVDPRIRLGGDN